MEPWLHEQQRQAAISDALARFPKCDLCGESITAERYLLLDGKAVCPDCVDRHMEYNMEVLWEI